ncbi:5470_t:CDS:1, partial [Gigaspora margarita]
MRQICSFDNQSHARKVENMINANQVDMNLILLEAQTKESYEILNEAKFRKWHEVLNKAKFKE